MERMRAGVKRVQGCQGHLSAFESSTECTVTSQPLSPVSSAPSPGDDLRLESAMRYSGESARSDC